MHGVEGLLLTSIGGYWVLERSVTQKKNMKRIGQWLGGAIIIASLVGVACRVWCAASCSRPFMGKKGYCPYSTPSAPVPPPAQ